MFSKEVLSHLQDHMLTILSSLQRKESIDEDTDYLTADTLSYDKYSFKMVNDHPVLQSMLWSKNETFIVVFSNKKEHQNGECDVDNRNLSLPESEHTIKLSSLADELGLDVVEGRPLECPFSADDPVFEYSVFEDKIEAQSVAVNPYPPITMAEALTIMGIFRKVMNLEAKNNPNLLFPPFAVLCDGKDVQGTIAIGLQKMANSLKRFCITCKDHLYTAEDVPAFDLLRKRHLMGRQSNNVSTEAKAKYIILESAGDSNSDSRAKSNVVLRCEWRNVRQVLETPSSDALCTVLFRVFLGDSQTMLKSKWEELMILKRMIQTLASNDLSWASSSSEISVLDKVKKLLDGMKTIDIRKNVASSRKLADESQADTILIKESLSSNRQNLDFTDKLWTVLKDCSSQDEVRECLKLVLLTVQSEEIKQITFGTSTALGKIVNDVYRQNSEIPNLDAMNPLSLLVEMGIEKLKQDYIFLFLISGLATKDILSPFMKSNSSNFNECFSCLKKLHCVTELIALCCVSISDAYPLVSTYARMALNQVSTIPFNSELHSFSFQIDRQSVLNDFNAGTSPSEWLVCLNSVQDEYIIHSTFQLTAEHPLSTVEKTPLALPGGLYSGQRYYLCHSSAVQGVC